MQSILSDEQEKALAILEQADENIFLTGSAGSGKSFLIRHFLRQRPRKTFPIVASTGAAAVLVGGRTFHSFFGLGIMEGGVKKTVERALANRRVKSRLKKISGFVLDEVSMIPGPALRAAETICRRARNDHRPWGGVRVIAVGDFFQLPPISNGPEREWAFLDETWEHSQFQDIILQTSMRTNDREYLSMLEHIREGHVDEEVRAFLDRHTTEHFDDIEGTHLFSRRYQAEQFNRQRLQQIEAPLHQFPTKYEGNKTVIKQLMRSAPIPESLELKEGALVMVRINDPGYQYVNGSTGTVVAIDKKAIEIELKNGRIVELVPKDFSLLNAEGDPIAIARNFPLILAYAITIHKAQGTTLNNLIADLRSLWEPGQAYVALSRLTSGDGLILRGWDERSIMVDPEVLAFHQKSP